MSNLPQSIYIDKWFDSEEESIYNVIKIKTNQPPFTNAEKQRRSRFNKEQLMKLKNDKYFKMNELRKLGNTFLEYPKPGSLGVATTRFDEIRKMCIDSVLNKNKKTDLWKTGFYYNLDATSTTPQREFIGTIPFELMYSFLT